MSKTYLNPKELFNSTQYGFSQIVTSTSSRMVHLSGQVAWDAKQQIVGPGELRPQVWQTLENLKIAMEKAGGSLHDVVSMRICIVEAAAEERNCVTDGLLAFFPADALPASTWLIVRGLANEAFLIEIEALGVIDE